MRRKFLLLIVLLCSMSGKEANAQSDTPKFEIGGHYTMMTGVDFGTAFSKSSVFDTQFNPGVGGRFTFNVTRNIALETELNLFPRESPNVGRKYQWLYGLKLGVRKSKFGVFAKVRPGYLYLTDDLCGGCGEGAFRDFIGGYERNPLVDVGGVIEFYPSRRASIRVDVGDTIVHFGTLTRLESDVNVSKQLAGKTTHGLQVNIGVGFRF